MLDIYLTSETTNSPSINTAHETDIYRRLNGQYDAQRQTSSKLYQDTNITIGPVDTAIRRMKSSDLTKGGIIVRENQTILQSQNLGARETRNSEVRNPHK